MASAPRFFVDVDLRPGDVLTLPPGASRHAQVLRMQPGHVLTLFNGRGTAHQASVLQMGRQAVQARVGEALSSAPAAPRWRVTLAVGMPANDRMDWLVEKATELGVASIQPLMTERSVLRLEGERAAKKLAHWQAVAVAACEQCGGNRVPAVLPVADLAAWLRDSTSMAPLRCVLSLAEGTRPLTQVLHDQPPDAPVLFLSGPEGGLSAQEDAQARSAGFIPVTLGPRVLRAETAALAALVMALA